LLGNRSGGVQRRREKAEGEEKKGEPFHSLTLPSSPDEAKIVPVTFHSTFQT